MAQQASAVKAPAEIFRSSASYSSLVRDYPPRLANSNKKILFAKIAAQRDEKTINTEFSRYSTIDIPDKIEGKLPEPAFSCFPSVFRYSLEQTGNLAFHVNFADRQLFAFYGSPLFAQDEIQCAEHPVLCSIREKYSAQALTRDEQTNRGTPVVCLNVPREAEVATGKIYGNQFARAAAQTIDDSTLVLTPDVLASRRLSGISHILAIEAPKGGRGEYSREQIIDVLETALTGFRACKEEAKRLENAVSGPLKVTIHTGNWGCGAFGGNLKLMAALQITAARLAGVENFVYWAVNEESVEIVEAARVFVCSLWPAESSWDFSIFLQGLRKQNFLWGKSNGT